MSSPRKQPAANRQPVQRRARRSIESPTASRGKSLGIAAVVIVIAALGGWYAYSNRTVSLEDRGDELVEIWNDAGLSGLTELYRWPDRESAAAMLSHIAATRGWESGAPRLEGPARREDSSADEARLTFQLAGEDLSSTWAPEDKSWRLTSLRLPFAGLDERFEALWKSGGPAAAAALCTISKREDQARALAKVARNRGWAPTPPGLTPAGTRETLEDGRMRVEYTAGKDRFHAIWAHTEGAWALVDLELAFGNLADQLRSAWNATDLERVGDFYSRSDKGVRAMESVMKMRKWDKLPEIASFELDESKADEVWMNCETAAGHMEARFRIKDGRWSLSGIRPPEE
ncbi:MAG: hypothetical protein GY711_16570 [bacterium]|nr:hypothetical protein [bacterium]